MVANDVAREEVRCALCDSDNSTLLFEVGGKQRNGVYLDSVFHPITRRERIVRCQECGLVYVNPRLAPTPGLTTYSIAEELAYFEATQADRQMGNQELLSRLEQLLHGSGRLLDVGCGDGLLLAQAKGRGWETWGLEVSAELVMRIRANYGLNHIFHGTLQEADYSPAYFDAVLCINVLEHLRNPRETIAEMVRVTRPGGIIAVHTPNLKSLVARWRGAGWRHFEPYEHFYYFSPKTLSRLLTSSGLEVVGPFALYGRSKAKRWLLKASHRLGLQLDNGLGLLACRPH